MASMCVPWTDLSSILASEEGRACLYGYLRQMDAGDPAPRRLHRYVEVLDEIALFRRQTDDAQWRAEKIMTYIRPQGALAGLFAASPSEQQLRQPELGQARRAFDALEADVHEALRPLVPQFLSDVKKGEKALKQRVKESGYLAYLEQLHGTKRRGANVCSLCWRPAT